MQLKPKVLFVDDEERIVNLLRTIFKNTYDVYTATSGEEAIALAGRHAFHVVVSDQRMPGLSGVELLSRFKVTSPNTMRILLTGYSDLAAIVGSVNDGEVFRFINKPWVHEELKEIVDTAAQVAISLPILQSEYLPPAQSAPFQIAPSKSHILVLDDDEKDRRAISELFSPHYTVHSAGTIQDSLQILEKHEIGVVVTEAKLENEGTGKLLHLLKTYHPTITTVMLTSSADSDLVIKLINQAQIYRFATKPIRNSVLLLAVSAAVREHQRFAADPRLADRQVVAQSTEAGSESRILEVLRSIATWRSRLFEKKAQSPA